ncbi:hypothetical protein V5N11_010843 [Cardamine amara subsp. amara]|uniref:No apical meristem-associated C-terminal domain-containing protein n=1 Tax=Cardamine amara subsp. amara TaxID=228776 RepID=A0ABD1BWX7_CARAN
MSVLLTACSKLRGCINQIENKNPSGASDQDIVDQAKILLTQDANYSKGFKFDHVWPILRVIEKFANNQSTRVAASHSSRFGASQEEPRNHFSSPSLQDDSPPTSEEYKETSMKKPEKDLTATIVHLIIKPIKLKEPEKVLTASIVHLVIKTSNLKEMTMEDKTQYHLVMLEISPTTVIC